MRGGCIGFPKIGRLTFKKSSVTPNHSITAPASTINIVRADYNNPVHAAALVDLLDGYASDVSGGGEPLSDFAKSNLVAALAARPQAFSVLAFCDDQPVGLINCIEGFSTFACKPLVNVHDVAVVASQRGQRLGEKMLALVEQIALERGACKLTLEVLQGNQSAIKLYERIGFAAYQLDPAMGQARFFQKWLG
jgi:ribosomal protein S18 acetylase RimI-like enzyme